MASSDSAGSSKLTKLKGRENYPFWRTQMQFYLDEHSCWEIVTGIEPYPGTSALQMTTSGSGAVSGAATPSNAAMPATTTSSSALAPSLVAIRDWKTRNACAARVIMTATSAEIRDNLTNFTDAASMWTYLKRYKGSGPAQRMDTYISWKDLQFTGKDLQLFTKNYQKALRQLDLTA